MWIAVGGCVSEVSEGGLGCGGEGLESKGVRVEVILRENMVTQWPTRIILTANVAQGSK